jgi:hypothetical protein
MCSSRTVMAEKSARRCEMAKVYAGIDAFVATHGMRKA